MSEDYEREMEHEHKEGVCFICGNAIEEEILEWSDDGLCSYHQNVLDKTKED